MTTSDHVEQFFRAFVDAHTRKDLEAIANSFTPETLYVRPGDTTLKGGAALAQNFAGDTGSYRFEPGDACLESGDMVVSVGKWFDIDEAGAESSPRRYVAVFRRGVDAKLRIVVGVPLVD